MKITYHVKVSFLGKFPNPVRPHNNNVPPHPSQLLYTWFGTSVGRAIQALCMVCVRALSKPGFFHIPNLLPSSPLP